MSASGVGQRWTVFTIASYWVRVSSNVEAFFLFDKISRVNNTLFHCVIAHCDLLGTLPVVVI